MKENIVLCGFMGCGKSTVGKRLSRALSMPVCDSDALIVERAGKPITKIFEEDGEEEFRRLEAACIKELGERHGVIIATGGGAVKNPQNVAELKKNGTIFYLNPSLSRIIKNTLSDHSRPLLEGTDNKVQRIIALRRQRHPIYQKACDVEIRSDKLANTVEKIVRRYKDQKEGRNPHHNSAKRSE